MRSKRNQAKRERAAERRLRTLPSLTNLVHVPAEPRCSEAKCLQAKGAAA